MALKLGSINVTITVGDDHLVLARPTKPIRSFEDQLREIEEVTTISAEELHKLEADAKALGEASKSVAA